MLTPRYSLERSSSGSLTRSNREEEGVGMADGVAQSQPLAQPHFARRATGFVRDVKVRDAVIFNVLPACPGLILAVSVFWVLSTFTGVNIYVAIAITIACSFLISGAFGLLSQIM